MRTPTEIAAELREASAYEVDFDWRIVAREAADALVGLTNTLSLYEGMVTREEDADSIIRLSDENDALRERLAAAERRHERWDQMLTDALVDRDAAEARLERVKAIVGQNDSSFVQVLLVRAALSDEVTQPDNAATRQGGK